MIAQVMQAPTPITQTLKMFRLVFALIIAVCNLTLSLLTALVCFGYLQPWYFAVLGSLLPSSPTNAAAACEFLVSPSFELA